MICLKMILKHWSDRSVSYIHVRELKSESLIDAIGSARPKCTISEIVVIKQGLMFYFNFNIDYSVLN